MGFHSIGQRNWKRWFNSFCTVKSKYKLFRTVIIISIPIVLWRIKCFKEFGPLVSTKNLYIGL